MLGTKSLVLLCFHANVFVLAQVSERNDAITLELEEFLSNPNCGLITIADADFVDIEFFKDMTQAVFNTRALSSKDKSAELGKELGRQSTCGSLVFQIGSTTWPLNFTSQIEMLLSNVRFKQVLILSYHDKAFSKELSNLQKKGVAINMLHEDLQTGLVRKYVGCPMNKGQRLSKVCAPSHNSNTDEEVFNCPSPLENQRLTVSHMGMAPYLVHNSDGSLTGSDMDILKILAAYHKFKFTTKLEPAHVRRNPQTQELEGTVPSVLRSNTAIGIGVHMVSTYFDLIDYASINYFYGVRYCTVKPRKMPAYMNLVLPFHSSVWGITIVLFVLSAIFYASLEGNGWKKKFQERILQLWGSQFTETMHFRRNCIGHDRSSFVFLFFWMLYVFLILSAYQCNLRAFLMKDNLEPTVDEEHDIINMGKRLYLPYGTFYPRYFKNSPFPLQRQLYEGMEKEGNYITLEKGLVEENVERKIVAAGDVFIWTPEQLKASMHLVEERYGWQPFRLGDKIIFATYSSWIVAKHHPFRDKIMMSIHRLTDTGIKAHLVQKYFKARYLLEDDQLSPPEPFEIAHVMASVVALAIGIAIAGAAFVYELAKKGKDFVSEGKHHNMNLVAGSQGEQVELECVKANKK